MIKKVLSKQCVRMLYKKISQIPLWFFIIFSIFSQDLLAKTSTPNFNVHKNKAQIEPVAEEELNGETPLLYLAHNIYNFGTVYRGQKLFHSFEFQNRGEGKLIFGSIHASCGCLNIKITNEGGFKKKNIFKSGEKGFIQVDFETKQFRGDVKRTITIDSNFDDKTPTISLTLLSKIEEEISANPALIYLGKIEKGIKKNYQFNVDVRSASGNTEDQKNWSEIIGKSETAKSMKSEILENSDLPKIIVAESTLPYIDVDYKKTGNNTYLVTLKIDESQNIPVGPINGTVVLWNNSSFNKSFEVPVVGVALGYVKMNVKYIEFGVVEDHQNKTKEFMLNSSRPDFKILNVNVLLKNTESSKDFNSNNFFKIDIKNAKSNSSNENFKINFNLKYPDNFIPPKLDNGDYQSVNISGTFLITTNDPDYSKISIPFFGVLKKKG